MIHDPAIQHAGNGTALIVPVAAIWAHVNPVLSGLLIIAGLCWYGVLFYDRFVHGHKGKEPPDTDKK